MKCLDSVVSRVSEISDDELVANLVAVERAYIHLLIEAQLRKTQIDPEIRLVGVVQRLRRV